MRAVVGAMNLPAIFPRTAFPFSPHLDQVDAAAQAFHHLTRVLDCTKYGADESSFMMAE
jgi:hypothetical protein